MRTLHYTIIIIYSFFMKTDDVKGQQIIMCAFDVYDRKRNAQSKRTHAWRLDEETTLWGFLTRAERKMFSEKCAEQEWIAFGCLITWNIDYRSLWGSFFSWKLMTLTQNSRSRSAQFCSNASAFPKCSTPECSLGWTNFGVNPVQK